MVGGLQAALTRPELQPLLLQLRQSGLLRRVAEVRVEAGDVELEKSLVLLLGVFFAFG